MNFMQSVKTCFRKYANFKGRATRSEFWWFQLFLFAAHAVSIAFDTFVLGYSLDDNVTPGMIICDLLICVPAAAVLARRLHDVGMTGWFQLPLFSFYFSYAIYYIPYGLLRAPMFLTALRVVVIILLLYWLWILYKCIKDSSS